MDTSFNHNNQKLPQSSKDLEANNSIQHLQQRLECNEARNRCLLEILPQIVWLAEAGGAIAYFNQRWYEYTGLTAKESLGWEFLKALHPEDHALLRDSYITDFPFLANADTRQLATTSLPLARSQGILGSKKPQSYELACRILGADGTYRWFVGQRTPVIKAEGQLLEWIGTYTLMGQPEQYLVAPWKKSEAQTPTEKSSKPQPQLITQLAVVKQMQANSRVRQQVAHKATDLTQQRLRNLVNEVSQLIVWEAEATTDQFTFVSQSAERLLGYPVEQWLKQADFWVNLIHPEDRQWTVALCRKEMGQSRDYELEYRCLAADKRIVWLRDRAYIVRDHQGQVYKRRGLMVDITLAKLVEAELQVHRRQQCVVAQLGRVALWGTEISTLMDEGVSLVCQTLAVEYCKVLELLPDETGMLLRAGVGWQPGLVGQAIIDASPTTWAGYTLYCRKPVVVEDLHHETRFRGSSLLDDHNIVSGMSVLIEAISQEESSDSASANISYRPFGVLEVHTSKRRVFSRNDVDFLQSVANVLAVAIKCQQANKALEKARSQLAVTTAILNQTTTALEKRNCELDQFAYVTSHDLKAPLRAIANLSQWIEEDLCDQLNEENLHKMQLMRGRVHRLEALIDGLLQYSRAGRLKSPPERVDVEDLLKHVIDALTLPAQFSVEIVPGMPTFVTERIPLEHVFTHLIGNAIKHHPWRDGRVKISSQALEDVYEFTVADNGTGIAPEFHKKIFTIFQTLQSRDTVENIGVGLAIAKRIVENKAGTIRLESQEGQGATFRFTWPKKLNQ